MSSQPDMEAVRTTVLEFLRQNPVGASSRYELADELRGRYASLDRDEARSLIGRALSSLQDAQQVTVLRPESWDMSGDERVRLVTSDE